MIVGAPIFEIRISDAACIAFVADFGDPGELIRVRVGKRAEQHGIDHTKERSGGSDAERQRDDRDEREAGIPGE